MNKWLVALCCVVWASQGHGQVQFGVPANLSLEVSQITGHRNPYIDAFDGGFPVGEKRRGEGEVWRGNVGVGFDLHLIQFTPKHNLYWNNLVSGDITTHQFRTVVWDFEAGLRLGPVDLFKRHRSEHCLECWNRYVDFPVKDEVGVRVRFLK